MKQFFLITNVQGLKYWSRLATKTDADKNIFIFQAIAKYGKIYINHMGGWFDEKCIKTIHKTVLRDNFPAEA